MRSLIPLALTLFVTSPSVLAWGTVGHATVATIGNNYLTPAAKTYVSQILGPGVTMASVASWADVYRATAAGKFSAPFHYIDAEDSPPSSCGVDLSRDCSGTCIVSAIANYTSRLDGDVASSTEKKQALEFIIHFLGDITQPLHTEAELLGGNDISVLWNGSTTNLHHTWDTQMVEKAAGGSTTTAYNTWAKTLIARIDHGSYSAEKASWIACEDIATASECALEWAKDSNAINCQYVLKMDESGQELSGAYYDGAKPYIEMQIAKGGYRLGAWLNAIAAAA